MLDHGSIWEAQPIYIHQHHDGFEISHKPKKEVSCNRNEPLHDHDDDTIIVNLKTKKSSKMGIPIISANIMKRKKTEQSQATPEFKRKVQTSAHGLTEEEKNELRNRVLQETNEYCYWK